MIETIVDSMGVSGEGAAIQRIQTAHRLKLIQFWEIPQGAKVLEIGCGQGDTTAALAYTVGASGRVQGIDIASPDYGSPVTLGEACSRLMASELGRQIQIQFETDILSPEVDFSEGAFDYIVFAHCAWYFQSAEQLRKTLSKIRPWGKKLCLAEWDIRVSIPEQLAHYNAVMIQAQCEAFKQSSLSNVRTLFSPLDLKEIARSAGWHVEQETSVYSPDLQDGEWEVAMTLEMYPEEIAAITEIPGKFKELMLSQIGQLKERAEMGKVKPLSVFTFTAGGTS
ncbi:class I SAM-dependent methyltransferase [Paenibacillus sp. NPDC058177]|uniref:class I SAM-dependent methyltransferase n=1 Tax=Paenibacillus sp. NPDC058177 TaxID=3346369 RepID=UPI0036DBDA1B